MKEQSYPGRSRSSVPDIELAALRETISKVIDVPASSTIYTVKKVHLERNDALVCFESTNRLTTNATKQSCIIYYPNGDVYGQIISIYEVLSNETIPAVYVFGIGWFPMYSTDEESGLRFSTDKIDSETFIDPSKLTKPITFAKEEAHIWFLGHDYDSLFPWLEMHVNNI